MEDEKGFEEVKNLQQHLLDPRVSACGLLEGHVCVVSVAGAFSLFQDILVFKKENT